ncbi:unnamed protein product [Penicillium salamii]|uniref:Uncharacterized protein n=1 Tax=Penicillium salamii TaxID=1612424 RepID=A0A9W4NPE5_9EURO|nr:unnamed protein product [Penicillium salamii]
MHKRTTSSTSVGFDHVCFDDYDQETIPEVPQSRAVKPYRSFNVFKDVALGTNAFSFCLQVHPSGGLAQSPSPVYHTLRIPWYKQGLYLPASFDLYAGGNVVSRKDPAPKPEDHRAHIHYRGFEGLLSLRASIDLVLTESGSDVNASVNVARRGIGRTYRVDIDHGSVRSFYWKGSKTALSLLESGESESSGNGNLKFFAADAPGDILAVWQNRTDRQILGSLFVIAELDAGTDRVLEGLMASCLAVVVAERVSGRGWVGGLGKSRGI